MKALIIIGVLLIHTTLIIASFDPFNELRDDSIESTHWKEDARGIHENGILLKKSGEVAIINGAWTVLITIERPILQSIDTWVNNITAAINTDIKWQNGITESWQSRIMAIKNKAQVLKPLSKLQSSERTRHKRGLFNFVASMSRTLFGTALDSDVEMLKKHVMDAEARQVVMHHAQESLISVVNKSKEAIEIIAEDVSTLTQSLAKFFDETNTANLTEKVDRLTASIDISDNILQMENMIRDYQWQIETFNDQRAALERAMVTRELLDEEMLQQIFEEMRKQKLNPPSMEWVYLYSSIHLVTDNSDTMAYVIVLPSLDDDAFIEYVVDTFMIPSEIGNHTLVKQINAEKSVAVNFKEMSFYPHQEKCVGNNPKICMPHKVFASPTCESSLVKQAKSPMCKLTVTERPENQMVEIVFYQHDKMILIPLIEEISIKVTCTKAVSDHFSQFQITKPFLLKLEESCTYDVADFHIKGLKVSHSNFYKPPVVYKPSSAVNIQLKQDKLKRIRNYFKQRQKLEIDIPDLVSNNEILPVNPWEATNQVRKIWDYALLVAGVIAIGLISVWACQKKFTTWRRVNGRDLGMVTSTNNISERDTLFATAPPETSEVEVKDQNTFSHANVYPTLPKSFAFGTTEETVA